LFEAQVEKSPDAIALVFEDQQMTFRQLNHKANQLAHYLISEGLQSETAVGVYLDRSIEFAVAILAVFKAGGVYVPVDPSYPIERATFILQDAQARFVVSNQTLASQLSLSGARTITLDTEMQQLNWDDYPNPQIIVGSQSPAYIFYTSGSTGIPKGVVMGHGA
jgi:non-ribosomal peptide synthetase component F